MEHDEPWRNIGSDLENQQSELLSLRAVIDHIAISEDDIGGVLGGLSYWLQRIIDDVENTKHKVPVAAASAT